jgi:predicted nuclease with TOPRIM domain
MSQSKAIRRVSEVAHIIAEITSELADLNERLNAARCEADNLHVELGKAAVREELQQERIAELEHENERLRAFFSGAQSRIVVVA